MKGKLSSKNLGSAVFFPLHLGNPDAGHPVFIKTPAELPSPGFSKCIQYKPGSADISHVHRTQLENSANTYRNNHIIDIILFIGLVCVLFLPL